MLEFLQTHSGWIEIFLATVVLGWTAKKMPAYVEAKAIAALDALFAAGDDADVAFFIAAIRWAEAKYGPKSGKEKADAVVTKIIALLPMQYRIFVTRGLKDKAIEMFQETFDRLEKATLGEAVQHDPSKP